MLQFSTGVTRICILYRPGSNTMHTKMVESAYFQRACRVNAMTYLSKTEVSNCFGAQGLESCAKTRYKD